MISKTKEQLQEIFREIEEAIWINGDLKASGVIYTKEWDNVRKGCGLIPQSPNRLIWLDRDG